MRGCRNCLFDDICPSVKLCEHYAPIEDDDVEFRRYDEARRKEFKEDWMEYVSEYGDSPVDIDGRSGRIKHRG